MPGHAAHTRCLTIDPSRMQESQGPLGRGSLWVLGHTVASVKARAHRHPFFLAIMYAQPKHVTGRAAAKGRPMSVTTVREDGREGRPRSRNPHDAKIRQHPEAVDAHTYGTANHGAQSTVRTMHASNYLHLTTSVKVTDRAYKGGKARCPDAKVTLNFPRSDPSKQCSMDFLFYSSPCAR
jgi:hypothetical protein